MGNGMHKMPNGHMMSNKEMKSTMGNGKGYPAKKSGKKGGKK